MGLDMYLFDRKTGKELGYWRKSNQIHNWFVDNVQDGVDNQRAYPVTKENLENLLEICKKIKEKAKLVDGDILSREWFDKHGIRKSYRQGKVIENLEEIKEILPTVSGFFFGNVEYNEYYMEDIDSTIRILSRVLQDADLGNMEVMYQADW